MGVCVQCGNELTLDWIVSGMLEDDKLSGADKKQASCQFTNK